MPIPGLLVVRASFDTTMKPAHDLIAIHKRNTRQGRRVADLSLNKGAVVFAVAAWQSYIQELAEAILVSLAPPPGDPTEGVYRMLAGRVREQIRRFNTPNSRNTTELLSLLGFEPGPSWGFGFTWERQASARYGAIHDSAILRPTGVQRELDAWLLVRHKIAHGDTLPNDPDRVSGTANGKPQLQRRNAHRCVAFFEGLVLTTDGAARVQFP